MTVLTLVAKVFGAEVAREPGLIPEARIDDNEH